MPKRKKPTERPAPEPIADHLEESAMIPGSNYRVRRDSEAPGLAFVIEPLEVPEDGADVLPFEAPKKRGR